ncbi:D-glycero-beta-D-manno-heptose 1-phosphate adenylyltransferase [Bacteroidota bacterium]|nr:D-glycero-beta-D-manno-heptose 1-phosphate adenylyltransferase [Bacteroidota bacterium]
MQRMPVISKVREKIINSDNLVLKVSQWKKNKMKVAFTNGCFDILHLGHLEILTKSKEFGDRLIVAVNSDESVRKLKGKERPVNDFQTRSHMLASFSFVDYVVEFSDDTPIKLIQKIKPNFLIKGGDYQKKDIVGNDIVSSYGGETIIIPLIDGLSSTNTINKINK